MDPIRGNMNLLCRKKIFKHKIIINLKNGRKENEQIDNEVKELLNHVS